MWISLVDSRADRLWCFSRAGWRARWRSFQINFFRVISTFITFDVPSQTFCNASIYSLDWILARKRLHFQNEFNSRTGLKFYYSLHRICSAAPRFFSLIPFASSSQSVLRSTAVRSLHHQTERSVMPFAKSKRTTRTLCAQLGNPSFAESLKLIWWSSLSSSDRACEKNFGGDLNEIFSGKPEIWRTSQWAIFDFMRWNLNETDAGVSRWVVSCLPTQLIQMTSC